VVDSLVTDEPVRPHASGTLAAYCLLSRDLRLAFNTRSDTLAAVIFVLVVILFPLGGWSRTGLAAPRQWLLVWFRWPLSAPTMLSLGRLFADDHQDGTLEQLLPSAPTHCRYLFSARWPPIGWVLACCWC